MSKVDTAVESEKPTEVTARSTGSVTDDELLDLSEDNSDKGDISPDSSTHTVVPENLSDNDSDFNSDLPTKVAVRDQAPLAKGGVVRVINLKQAKGNPRRQYRSKQRRIVLT